MARVKKEIQYGVYGIYQHDKLLYIGSTNDFLLRQHQHLKKLKDGTHIKTLQKYVDDNVKDIDLDLEFRLIHVPKDSSKVRLFFCEIILIQYYRPLNKAVLQFGLKYIQFGQPVVNWNLDILNYL